MIWTEVHHATLIGLFFLALRNRRGEAGIECFKRAIKRYAEQRGQRMALRAKSHGFEADFSAYFSHGEWAPTQPPKLAGKSFSDKDDWVILNPECLWLSTFQEMELPECAKVYCALIDTHLLKGFNPKLKLEVTSFLHSSEYCTFQWKNANLTAEDWKQIGEIKTRFENENVKLFDYHTGHVWKTFQEEMLKDEDDQNLVVLNQIAKAFETKFGKKAMERIFSFESTDFQVVEEYDTEKKCYEIVNCPMNGTDPKTAKCQVYQEQVGCWEYDWGALYRVMPEGEEKEKWQHLMVAHCPTCPVYKKHQDEMNQRLKKLKPIAEGSNEE